MAFDFALVPHFVSATRSAGSLREAIGILELDDGDRVFDANRRAQDWFGLGLSDLMARHADWLFRKPDAEAGPLERVPDLYFLKAVDGSELPVFLVCEATSDGHQFVSMSDATCQIENAQRVYQDHALANRTQQRLELVVAASVAFADAISEIQIAETLRTTAMGAYAAEGVGVVLFDENGFELTAGSNSLGEFDQTVD